MAVAKTTICLWYDKDAESAARFYAETFPDSAVHAVHRAPADYPSGKAGDVLTVEFTVAGIPCLGLNGGQESDCGWRQDKWGRLLADHAGPARPRPCAAASAVRV